MNNTPQKLYHYCSIESFFHIIKSKSIWLSNSNQMNDSNENTWIENYFNLVKDFFKDIKYAPLLKHGFGIYNVNKNPPYIFCLSESKDLLSQWRAYSKDGHGVSIGLNTKSLNLRNAIPMPNIYAHYTLGLVKIKYQTSLQEKDLIKLCSDIKTMYDAELTKADRAFVEIHLGLQLLNKSIIFKNYNFQEEKEWRIIHTPGNQYEEGLDNLSELQFRVTNDKILSYYNYCFKENFNSSLVNEIVIGPKCKMSISEINEFLKDNNLGDTEVIKSKSTYR